MIGVDKIKDIMKVSLIGVKNGDVIFVVIIVVFCGICLISGVVIK